jgi:F-type H+-transporting ATPase subunit delta
MTGAVARRYARALFALATDEGSQEQIGRALAEAADAFAQAPLKAFAENTSLDRKIRRAVVKQLAQAGQMPRSLANFLGVLAENNRLTALASIAVEYGRLEDRRLGRVRASLKSARPLSDESRSRIHEALERRTAKRVIAEDVIAPELLGGVVVEIQGRVFDGSVRTRLERLKRSLVG